MLSNADTNSDDDVFGRWRWMVQRWMIFNCSCCPVALCTMTHFYDGGFLGLYSVNLTKVYGF